MSELIRKYKPPKISKLDLEKGVRYLSEVPEQVDDLGNVLAVGDLVIYASGYNGSPDLHVGKIIGMFSKIIPRIPENRWQQNDSIHNGIGIVILDYNGIRKLTTYGSRLIKFSEELCNDEVRNILIPA